MRSQLEQNVLCLWANGIGHRVLAVLDVLSIARQSSGDPVAARPGPTVRTASQLAYAHCGDALIQL